MAASSDERPSLQTGTKVASGSATVAASPVDVHDAKRTQMIVNKRITLQTLEWQCTVSSVLLHIIGTDDLRSARETGEIVSPSLAEEGFIHCSYENQVLTPANQRFSGRHDLVLLVLDAQRIPSPLVIEDSYGSGTEFPHVYGPIPVDAIIRIVEFPPNADGSFELPSLR